MGSGVLPSTRPERHTFLPITVFSFDRRPRYPATRSGRGACGACLALLVLGLLGASTAFAALNDAGVYAPPATGAFAYNGFVPELLPGVAYVDPVFGESVRRLTTDHARDDLYARNMWWSADESRFLHRTYGVAGKPDRWDVIDAGTGVITHTGIPFGTFAADGGFDPVDANALYYLVQNRGDGHGEIHRITLGPAGTWTDTVYFTAPAAIADLGGTLNWLDAGGRYMLVRYGPEPSVYLYDRQDLAAGPYANPIDATNSVEHGGYLGLTPDGQFVVGYDDRPVGYGRMGQGVSWKINHASRTVASAPTAFWSLCGDHGSFLSASDGRNYMIVNDCYSQPGLWRVDITNSADGLDEQQQLALPNNARLLAFPTWRDFGHVSTVARGAMRDWAFLASEDGSDTFDSGTADSAGNITPWHAYRQEIIALNVLTGEIRRLAHHRSRSVTSDYYSTPRLSASWGGRFVAFASNFNQRGSGIPVVDIYAIPFVSFTDSAAPTVSITTPSVGQIVSGTVTVSASASGNADVVGVRFTLDGANLGPEVLAAPFAILWDSTTAADGPHILTATARDATGRVATSLGVPIIVVNTSTASGFSDSFDRPDSTSLGDGWQLVQGDLRVSGSEARNAPTPGLHMAVVAALEGAGQEAGADFASTDNNPAPSFAVVLCYQDPQNYYLVSRLVGGSSLLRISLISNGVERVLAAAPLPNPIRDTFFRLTGRITGTTLTAELDGLPMLSVSDATLTGGGVGMAFGSLGGAASLRADNFTASVQ